MQPGYHSGSEPMWWWKVAMHLDEAQRAFANAMAHNVDDPRPAHALYERIREGQAILLAIFRAKGLLPRSTNGKMEVPMPSPPPATPIPPSSGDTVPMSDVVQPLAADESAVPDADHAAASEPVEPEFEPESEPDQLVSPPLEAVSETIQTELSPPTPLPTVPSAGSVGG